MTTTKTYLAFAADSKGQAYLTFSFFEGSIGKRIWVQHTDDGRWLNIGPLDDSNRPAGFPCNLPIHPDNQLTDEELISTTATMLLALTGYNRPHK
jgi:hypothetical protein